MASTIQIRVDDDLKNKSYQLFKDLGTDTTSAIRMFLTQAVAYNGFPFEIKRTVHNPYTSMTEECISIFMTFINYFQSFRKMRSSKILLKMYVVSA